MSYFRRMYRSAGDAIFVGLIIYLGINIWILDSTTMQIVPLLSNLTGTHAQAVLILGAQVRWTHLSDVLRDRVDTAIAIYRAGLVDKLLVSGDRGNKYYNEVSAIYLYLKSQGIHTGDIFLDIAWFDTYDSLYRAKHIFGVSSLIIATQKFHLPRAVYIANQLGIASRGVVADQRPYRDEVRNQIRESLARVKAVVDISIGSSPAVLGKSTPITWSSNASLWEK